MGTTTVIEGRGKRAERLVEEALFLQMCGERPPGAPPEPHKETWRDWNFRAERFLRGLDVDDLAGQIVAAAYLWAGGTAEGMAEAERILATSPVLGELAA